MTIPDFSSVSAISDWYVDALAAASPNMATALGIPGRETDLTDYSPDGHEERSAIRRQAEAALRMLNVETERDRVARDVMLERFDYEAELEAQQEHLRSLNILASPLQNTRQVFDLMPRETEEDQANIVEADGRGARGAGALSVVAERREWLSRGSWSRSARCEARLSNVACGQAAPDPLSPAVLRREIPKI